MGGEIGGVDIPNALTVSLPAHLRKKYLQGSDLDRIAIEQEYGANRDNSLAYIPDTRLYKKNLKTPLIVNSVGLSDLNVSNRRVKAILRRVIKLSVRDAVSKKRTKAIYAGKIWSAPDIVHTLPLVYTPTKKEDVGILVQFNERYAKEVSNSDLKASLARIAQEFNSPITFVLAGTAYGHDSVRAYRPIIDHLKQIGIKVNLVESRAPLDIVDYISSAHVTISTSLHIRIISAAYGVGRVSLFNEKVSRYASEWDPDFPFNTPIGELLASVRKLESISKDAKKTAHLTELAYDNFVKMKAGLLKAPIANYTPPSREKLPNLDASSGVVWGLEMSRDLVAARQKILHSNYQMDIANNRAEYYKELYEGVARSKAWSFVLKTRKITSLFKR